MKFTAYVYVEDFVRPFCTFVIYIIYNIYIAYVCVFGQTLQVGEVTAKRVFKKTA